MLSFYMKDLKQSLRFYRLYWGAKEIGHIYNGA